MAQPTGERPPTKGPGNVRFRVALYVFWTCLGLAAVARLVEGGQSVLGFWSSIFGVIVGAVSALALLYGAVTGRVP
jgi:hypothetical protein